MLQYLKVLCTSFIALLLFTVILGILYPLAGIGIAHLLTPKAAEGSLVYKNNQIIGSSLIGQSFVGNLYFQSRPSAAGNGYDPTNSSGSNLSQTSKALIDSIQARVKVAQAFSDHPNTPVPIDLVTASGSGLDPDASPAAMYYQAKRIAKARHLSLETINALIKAHIQPRQLGFLGEPRVNVLELNLALDQLEPNNNSANPMAGI